MLASLICPFVYWAKNFYALGLAGFVWLIFWGLCYEERYKVTTSLKDYGLPTSASSTLGDDEEREGLLFDVGGVTMQRTGKHGGSGGKW